MICVECRYELDACCRDYICCCCSKKLYNNEKRDTLNTISEQSNVICIKCDKTKECCTCYKKEDVCNSSIIVRESNFESCTISSELINKLSLPIIVEESYSNYLIEWYMEISTTNDALGDAKINIMMDKLPENESENSVTLSDIRIPVTKGIWVPYSGFAKVILDSSGIINLGYAVIAPEPKSKSICVRNVRLSAIKTN